MLYKFLRSNKGFTLTELMAVVVILSILLAIGVPFFGAVLKKQREDDCRNQCLVIETAVKQAMHGMIDNGAKQPEITFKCTVVGADGIGASADVSKAQAAPNDTNAKCFVLTDDPETCFTLAELRGGYRVGTFADFKTQSLEDYKDGCEKGQYLKKLKYQYKEGDSEFKGTPFYAFLDNAEVPVCPFEESNKTGTPYFYYVLKDGTVHCTCESNENK